MANLVINSLWSVNCYLNGTEFLGQAAEVKIPQPKRMMVDYKGLGMAARIKVPTGWEDLECSIKWASFNPDVISEVALSNSLLQLSFLGDLQTITANGEVNEQPVICNVNGMPIDIGPLDFKAQELIEFTTTLTAYHVDLSVGGVQLYLYDSFSNQYIVGGVNQLANFTANQGD